MRCVILESPYRVQGGLLRRLVGQWLNRRYGRRCLRDSLQRGEAPIASHLLYTQPGVLRDDVPAERRQSIQAGLAWRTVAEASVVYIDRGYSEGMRHGVAAARGCGIPVEFRKLDGPLLGLVDEAD